MSLLLPADDPAFINDISTAIVDKCVPLLSKTSASIFFNVVSLNTAYSHTGVISVRTH